MNHAVGHGFVLPARVGEFATRRWETGTRWYEARVVYDLLGDWTVVRRWGGLRSHLGGQMVESVDGYGDALDRLDRIDRERRRRPAPYRRVRENGSTRFQ